MKKTLFFILSSLPSVALAGFNFSYADDIVELGYSLDIKDNSYIYLGADSANWFAIGYGHSHLFESLTRISGYYEYSQWDNVLLGEFGVKTQSNLLDLTVTQFFESYSIKLGAKYELIDDSGWEFEAGDKQSVYTGYSYYFDNWYLASTYTHSYRRYDDDLWGDSDSNFRSNEVELTLGINRIWKVSPYIKTTAYRAHSSDTYYSWSLGGTFAW
ncbi:hypothetical protein L1D24_14135 [Vibrio brasiliensis]|uniref:hypothetical protein n=1 Tax=Vibrio brasiliensis TaxID=170652 RepID=UPI001EFD1A2C|nr:hypothetical protein [Vibrio brasiliensis]MCG9649711.1 hypothetical protein [Vibrio brasiliensis]